MLRKRGRVVAGVQRLQRGVRGPNGVLEQPVAPLEVDGDPARALERNKRVALLAEVERLTKKIGSVMDLGGDGVDTAAHEHVDDEREEVVGP
jgi:hypothetical protein